MSNLCIAMVQFNPLVGDIEGNTGKIIEIVRRQQTEGADIVVFPELSLIGYPPEDLLLRPSIKMRVERALEKIKQEILSSLVVVGYPGFIDGKLFNMAGLIQGGQLVYQCAKRCLPNYQVFDEYRYFSPGTETGLYVYKGVKLGVSVCEDIWGEEPFACLAEAGAQLVININGSPFHHNKQEIREKLVSDRARKLAAPIIYVNQVGGQDELVFDGGSMAVNKTGEIVKSSPFFKETSVKVLYNATKGDLIEPEAERAYSDHKLSNIYEALVLGVRDYVNKNKFSSVVLGLSGGIDSALTLAIAADALGPDRVEAVMMPFKYTSQMSLDDAEEEAGSLGVKYRVIPIEPMYEAFIGSLETVFAGREKDTTEENIQARIRGILLMAQSNKFGSLVLTTGNKSEMAVGYATIYGDMAGGLDVLKDVSKTTVFALSRHRNTIGKVIPERVITRPPSAELAPDQKDEDSLPPYSVLDQILERYIEQDQSAEQIIEQGFDREAVKKVLRLVDVNEYKRRQAPPGIRISERAFGRDRRYPITNGWQIGD